MPRLQRTSCRTPRSPGPTRRSRRRSTSRTSRRPTKEELSMTDAQYQQLSREELDALAGEPLPERAAMSLINANIAAPVNAAVALNVLSDNSVAYANAEQTAPITQGN